MSTERMSTMAGSRRWLHVGPLASDLDGFAAALLANGYARASVERKLRLLKRLSCWLKDEGIGVNALDEARFESFLLSGRSLRGWGHRATGEQFPSYLRKERRFPEAVTVSGQTSPLQRIERRYQRILL